jgi:hypothetical protein
VGRLVFANERAAVVDGVFCAAGGNGHAGGAQDGGEWEDRVIHVERGGFCFLGRVESLGAK